MGKSRLKETVFVLTKADRDRIEAAIGLMRLIIRELMVARRTRVNTEVHTPGSLFELAENLEKLHGGAQGTNEDQLNFTNL